MPTVISTESNCPDGSCPPRLTAFDVIQRNHCASRAAGQAGSAAWNALQTRSLLAGMSNYWTPSAPPGFSRALLPPSLYGETDMAVRSVGCSMAPPAPSTAQRVGSLPIRIGRCVAPRSSYSSLLSKAPPPVSTMRVSTMSAASSGGIRSRHVRAAFTKAARDSWSASRSSCTDANRG